MPATINNQGQKAPQVVNGRREPTSILLLNRHSIKPTPSDLSLYPQITASPNYRQRNLFSMTYVVIKTETHK